MPNEYDVTATLTGQAISYRKLTLNGENVDLLGAGTRLALPDTFTGKLELKSPYTRKWTLELEITTTSDPQTTVFKKTMTGTIPNNLDYRWSDQITLSSSQPPAAPVGPRMLGMTITAIQVPRPTKKTAGRKNVRGAQKPKRT